MLAKEGYPTIGVVIAFSVIVGWLLSGVDHWVSYLIYGVLAALCLLVIYFFRDPERRSPADPNLILSPADGQIGRASGRERLWMLGSAVGLIRMAVRLARQSSR